MNKVLKIAIVVVLCLIVILTITLFAFNGNNGQGGSSTSSSTTSSTTTGGGNPECTEHIDANEDKVCDTCGEPIEDKQPECTEHIDENEDNLCDTCGAEIEASTGDMEFTKVEDKVYVITTELNLRTSPNADTDDNKANISVHMDDVLWRTGYNAEWTRVSYEGETYYVNSKYVVVGEPIVDFDETNDTVYYTGPYSSIKVRFKPTLTTKEEYSFVVGTINYGTELKRLGVAKKADVSIDDDGEAYEILWAKVEFIVDGVKITGYINNKYLSTNPNPQEGNLVFEGRNDKLIITAKESYGLRTSPKFTTDGSNIGCYVIPGTAVLRIGKATTADDDGIYWSKVQYNGETYYMNAEKPEYAVLKGNESDNETETFDKLFRGTYSIILPESYDIIANDATQYIISNGTTVISVANSGNVGDITITQFAQTVIDTLGLENVEVQTKDGKVYFEFEVTTTLEGTAVTEYYLVVFTEGKENNYFGTTFGAAGTKEDNSAFFWTYAGQIRAVAPAN